MNVCVRYECMCVYERVVYTYVSVCMNVCMYECVGVQPRRWCLFMTVNIFAEPV